MTFKEQFVDFGEIARELMFVRSHNLKMHETYGRWVPGYLLFSEGLMVLLAIERFLRIILGPEGAANDTLPNLLEKATSTRLNLLVLPPWWTRKQTIDAMKAVRNAIMHGNFEQAATQAGSRDTAHYFRSSAYINEVETLHRILDGFCTQIDPETGEPRVPRPLWPQPEDRTGTR